MIKKKKKKSGQGFCDNNGEVTTIHSFLLSYHHHLSMSMTRHLTLSSPPPSKWAKKTPQPPPAPPPPPASSPPTSGPGDGEEPSVFDVLNIFHSHWFLNRDHLIANVLSAQKAEDGRYTWVDFLLPFHTHLVQQARMLLPPLCPVAKGKKVLFVFILEILDGDKAQSGSFWEVPKKHCRCCLIKLKKPKVTPGIAHVAPKKPEVSPTTTMVAQAILKKPDQVEEDAMTGVEPSVPADPPCSRPFSPSPRIFLPFTEEEFTFGYSFPCEFDHVKIEKWLREAKSCAITFRDLGALVREAGHTGPDCLQRIHMLILAVGLPPPPSFKSATSS